jgi:hypothetical protein
MTIQRVSTITCPQCGAARAETMPTTTCQIRYACPACGAVLRPHAGDCCVFCSYGTSPCPSVQEERAAAHHETED